MSLGPLVRVESLLRAASVSRSAGPGFVSVESSACL